jgi:DNA-binding transcriptional ArsR family regulator
MSTDRTATTVFRLLSDETRLDILCAVAEAQLDYEEYPEGPVRLSFSEIYERVAVENTSKLSYHLGELEGVFLRKSEQGYSFTHVGERLTRFVLARNYERPASFDPIETAGTCPFCEAESLEARLHHQFLLVTCTECGQAVSNYQVTPTQVRSHDEQELIRSVKRKQATDYGLVRRGICPECTGNLSTEIRSFGSMLTFEADPFFVFDRCSECLRYYNALLTYGIAYHPASVSFHWDHGVDVTTMGLWEFHEYLTEDKWTAEQVATDPPRYEVEFTLDGDLLRCTVDGEATVTGTERVRRR